MSDLLNPLSSEEIARELMKHIEENIPKLIVFKVISGPIENKQLCIVTRRSTHKWRLLQAYFYMRTPAICTLTLKLSSSNEYTLVANARSSQFGPALAEVLKQYLVELNAGILRDRKTSQEPLSPVELKFVLE